MGSGRAVAPWLPLASTAAHPHAASAQPRVRASACISAASPTKAIAATTACSTSTRTCVDAKDHDFELLTGVRPAGEPVHDMWVRVTIDRNSIVHAIEVRTDGMPYPGACDRIEPAYAKLVGANLVRAFASACTTTMGGMHGCTHVTELLGSLPTAAVQTFAGLRSARTRATASRSSSTAATRSRPRPTPSAATIRSGIGARHPDARAQRSTT